MLGHSSSLSGACPAQLDMNQSKMLDYLRISLVFPLLTIIPVRQNSEDAIKFPRIGLLPFLVRESMGLNLLVPIAVLCCESQNHHPIRCIIRDWDLGGFTLLRLDIVSLKSPNMNNVVTDVVGPLTQSLEHHVLQSVSRMTRNW